MNVYPLADFYIMLVDMALVLPFIIRNWMHGKRKPIDRMFTFLAICLMIWQAAVMAMRLFDPLNERALFICDAVSNIGVACVPPATLLVALAFSKRLSKQRVILCLLVPAAVSILMVFTTGQHHLYYRVFSIYANQIRFGPYFYVQGAYGYLCLISSFFVIVRHGRRSRSKTCRRQAGLFAVSIIVPLIVNMLATFSFIPLSIAATPLAFTFTVACHAAAIYWLGFLNLAPMALQRIADSLSDAYVVLDEDECVYSCNKNFMDTFALRYQLLPGRVLEQVCPSLNDENRSFLYNLKNSVSAVRQSLGVITYEQTTLMDGHKRYYVVEINPLLNGTELGGYLALFRDVTRLREVMQHEQENMSRAMERERLASLGQMIGGIAHNLKTPIMSISGSVSMLDNLVREYKASIGDPEVTNEDHQAIGGEMDEWIQKIRSCCSYMSDIITTVKGLATNMNTSETAEFTADELMKRVFLLMQQELKRGKCRMEFTNDLPPAVKITGDVNNLVQVLSNLVGNAVDAMPAGGEIKAHAFLKDDAICLSVSDQGMGVPPNIKEKLFKEMFTSKGAKGTGLGLYMSAALMRGKFGGKLWLEQTSHSGSTFCLSIPHSDNPEEGREKHAEE